MKNIRGLKRELERLETLRNHLEEKYQETLAQELRENNPGTKIELRKQRESYQAELKQVETEIDQIRQEIAELENQADTSKTTSEAPTPPPFNIFIAHHQNASDFVRDLQSRLMTSPNGNRYDITLSENVDNNALPLIREADIFILVFSGVVDDMQSQLWRYAIVLGKRIIPILHQTTLAVFAQDDFVNHHNLDKAVNNPIVTRTNTISDADINRLREQMRGRTYIADIDENMPSQTNNYRPIPRIFQRLKNHILNNKGRFINIIGNGDNGKSRMAIELAGCYIIRNWFSDGICWIDLKKLKRPTMVWKKLAQFFESAPAESGQYTEYIKEKTRGKQYLFIIDSYNPSTQHSRIVSAFQQLGGESCLIVISREAVNNNNILFEQHPMSLLEDEKLVLLAKELGAPIGALPDIAHTIVQRISSSFHIVKLGNFIRNKLNDDANREKGYTVSNPEIWEEVERDKYFFRDMVKRDFGHLATVYQEQFKKLVIFNHGDDIPQSALEALWQVEADTFKDYIYQLSRLKYIVQNEDGTYQFVSSFLDYLGHSIRRAEISAYHQTLLTGYYPESLFKPSHDRWHEKVDKYLSEWLPHHLIEADKADILYRILTTSNNWVEYRLKTNIHYLKDDLEIAKEAHKSDISKQAFLMMVEHWVNDQINNQDILELAMNVLYEPRVSLDSVIQRILFPKTPTNNPTQQIEHALAICSVEGATAFTETYISLFDDLIGQISDPKKVVEFKLYLAKAVHANPDFTPTQKSALLKRMVSSHALNSDEAHHLKIVCAQDNLDAYFDSLERISSMKHYSEAISHIAGYYHESILIGAFDNLVQTAKNNPIKRAYVLLAIPLDEAQFMHLYQNLITKPTPKPTDLYDLCYLAQLVIQQNYPSNPYELLTYIRHHAEKISRNEGIHNLIFDKLVPLFATLGDAVATLELYNSLSDKNKKLDCLVDCYTCHKTSDDGKIDIKHEIEKIINEDADYESLQDKWWRCVLIGLARKKRAQNTNAYSQIIAQYRLKIKGTKPEAWFILRHLVLHLIYNNHEKLARAVLTQINALPNDVLAELMVDLTCIGKTDTARTFIQSFNGDTRDEYRDKIHLVIETLDELRRQRMKMDEAIARLAHLFHREYRLSETPSTRDTSEVFSVTTHEEPSVVSKKLGRWLAYETGIEAYRHDLVFRTSDNYKIDYHEIVLRILPDTNTFLHRIDMMKRVLARGDTTIADKIHNYMTHSNNRNKYFLESQKLITEFAERRAKSGLALLEYLHERSNNMRDFVAEVVQYYTDLGMNTPKPFIGDLARLMTWADKDSPFWSGLSSWV